jgi:hypothetical protein
LAINGKSTAGGNSSQISDGASFTGLLADHGGRNEDGDVREPWERTCVILDVGIHSFEPAMFWIVNSAKHGKCVTDFGTVE